MANINCSVVRLTHSIFIAPAIALGLGACAPVSSSFKANDVAATSVKPPPPIEEPLDKLTCLTNAVDYSLVTNVVDFHMTDKTRVNVGAKVPVGGVLTAVGIDLGVTYETGELHTAMHLSQPLYGTTSVSDKQGSKLAEKISFDVDFGTNIVNLGIGYMTTTPIGQLSQGALDDNLQQIMADITSPWSTTISQVNGADDIEIPVGTAAGLQVGDEFSVFDVEYRWEDPRRPCETKLHTTKLISPDPIATLVVAQANSPTTTILAVKELHGSTTLAKYQKVVLSKLFVKTTPVCKTDYWTGKTTCVDQPIPRAPLKRSIKIAEVSGEPIYFNLQGSVRSVDITKMMNEQLKVMLNSDKFSFYLKQ